MIEVSFRCMRGGAPVAASFCSDARIVALQGPSGAGKTTTLDVIAGILRPEGARVVVEGVTLADTAAGIFLPPHRRGIGYVFQDFRLFPHLTVRQNLGYARWFAFGARRSGPAEATIELLGLAPLLDRWPASLSGGEKQRVAIGRALASNPRLLLLDEPLASVDESRRSEIFTHIEELRDNTATPILYVTHNAGEITRLQAETVQIGQRT